MRTVIIYIILISCLSCNITKPTDTSQLSNSHFNYNIAYSGTHLTGYYRIFATITNESGLDIKRASFNIGMYEGNIVIHSFPYTTPLNIGETKHPEFYVTIDKGRIITNIKITFINAS